MRLTVPKITNQQIDAILPFLDRFEVAGFSSGTWNSPPGQMPWFSLHEAVSEFQQALYDDGWIVSSFKWPDWQEAAQEVVASPEKLESVDTKTIQKLLTTHVRKERFCEGHLATMFENGHIVALLKRLKTIRAGEE